MGTFNSFVCGELTKKKPKNLQIISKYTASLYPCGLVSATACLGNIFRENLLYDNKCWPMFQSQKCSSANCNCFQLQIHISFKTGNYTASCTLQCLGGYTGTWYFMCFLLLCTLG